MRIGIVTQRLGSNYGGILQNYALQYVSKQLGHQPITFDIGKRSWSRWFLECIKTWVKLLIGRPTLPIPLSPCAVYRRERALRRFVKKYINMTSPIWHIKSKHIHQYQIEALILGSDQIWRPMFSNVPEAFGEFAAKTDIPKIAYAASFGLDTTNSSGIVTKTKTKTKVKRRVFILQREFVWRRIWSGCINISRFVSNL